VIRGRCGVTARRDGGAAARVGPTDQWRDDPVGRRQSRHARRGRRPRGRAARWGGRVVGVAASGAARWGGGVASGSVRAGLWVWPFRGVGEGRDRTGRSEAGMSIFFSN
jgi:hypothetical protein